VPSRKVHTFASSEDKAIFDMLAQRTRREGPDEDLFFKQRIERIKRIFYFMATKILKVVRQGEAFSVQSSKQESGQIQKCTIVLKELGGSKFENEYVCTMLGNLAGCRFFDGDVVAATLRFSTHEYQGQVFQEVLATDIVKIN
jgi:hypothetical protein